MSMRIKLFISFSTLIYIVHPRLRSIINNFTKPQINDTINEKHIAI